ncbi:ATP-binding protein [Lentzea albida]|uniref:Anti-sigma regulatory factor (Ser/Thr protein kinase) n=1 Tax=Lentzea albida TaxID=65499 RepID=A0A1H9WEQ1_9PSEU|nr:ATP-binding protein [Lentzea albida]SES32416.1 Anti-sigma regulatory factor (Ser/Thr protein kinase) [Lentzea albida]
MSSHSAFVYGSPDELVQHALTAHRSPGPLVLGCSPRHNALITAALAPGSDARTLTRPQAGTRPGTAIAVLERLVRECGPVTVLVEPDHGATAAGTTRWRRFEAACNLTLAPRAVTLICAFDGRSTPDAVLAALAESHGHHDDPEAVLDRLAVRAPLVPPPADPVLVVLGSASIDDLGPIRRRVSAALGVLPVLARTDFVAAVNEVLTNAHLHGRPPVDTRLWVSPDFVECRITDRGRGFGDAGAGFRPGAGGGDLRRAGAGLRLTRQTCDDLDTWHTATTFTVRLSSATSSTHDMNHNGAIARVEAAQVRADAALTRAEAARVRAEATRERLAGRIAPPH